MAPLHQVVHLPFAVQAVLKRPIGYFGAEIDVSCQLLLEHQVIALARSAAGIEVHNAPVR